MSMEKAVSELQGTRDAAVKKVINDQSGECGTQKDGSAVEASDDLTEVEALPLNENDFNWCPVSRTTA